MSDNRRRLDTSAVRKLFRDARRRSKILIFTGGSLPDEREAVAETKPDGGDGN